ncbi:MAG: ATP-binding protein [Candidatus Sulfotelmatobacter sp.]
MATATRFPWPLGSAGTELGPLLENAPMGIAQCDRDGNLLAMNPALTALLGIAPQILVPRFADIVSLENHNLTPEIFRRIMSGEQAGFQIDSPVKSSNGAAKWLRWTVWGVCGSVHTPDCVLLLAEDVTEKREQEQRFAKAEQWQVLGRMAVSIAHDFNNLLTGILLYSDLMLNSLNVGDPGNTKESTTSPMAEGACARERLREYAEEIRSAGLQATGVVQQLLSVTRPRTPHPYPISLNAIAEQMGNLLLRLLGENIELSFHLDPALALVSLDPAQAQQILLNLVLNARDAMPRGGRIRVETEDCSVQVFRNGGGEQAAGTNRLTAIPCVLFVVRDNGIGMTEETRRRVFHTYFTTKEEGKGSGLGMTTVHSIVAACGGLVQVESAPGRGTSVIVLLPAASSRPIAQDTTQASPHLI